MASVIGRAPRSPVAAWNATQSAGSSTAVKAVIFTGDQRPDRSRRNGIIDPDSSADINILGLQARAQSLEEGLAFTGNHDLKSERRSLLPLASAAGVRISLVVPFAIEIVSILG